MQSDFETQYLTSPRIVNENKQTSIVIWIYNQKVFPLTIIDKSNKKSTVRKYL